ncbi:YadA-like family protein [Haemophilus haemolyticus]|uniref:YadA-like family protein n=1 Tax=Haemophilus haemolyticus TaxID=726 RepID=UPI0012906BB4|nr:YadA-like family protein [Haemophilus haemolyticus]
MASGWQVAGDEKAKVAGIGSDDQVNFTNGNGTTVSVTVQDEVKETVTENGKQVEKIKTPKGANVKFDVKAANNTITVTNEGVKVNTGNISTTAVPTVTKGDANKIATVGNVADAIKAAAWKATSDATTDGENSGKTEQEVKAGDTVTFEADKNIKITQNAGKFTFATKDNVTFTTIQVGGDQGPKLSKTDDGDLKVSGPNGTDPVKVTNVKSGLNKYGDQVNGADVPGTTDKNRGLVDLSKPTTGEPKVSDNTAATVGDLRNMGWVVSSNKTTGDLGNPYSETVKNADEVKFVGKNGIQVSGKTDDKGVRTLTFEMEAGEVTPTEITKADGTKLVKVGDKVYKPEDIGTDGQPKQGKDPVGTIANDGKVYNNGDVTNGAPNNGANPIDGITVTPNNGSKFVTGNQVADAIEKSGFVVGKNNKALSASDFKNEDEKVNPNDELRFADGDNTNVKLATKEELDASGKVKTVTTVKVDVVDLPVKYTDADGNIVKKGEDGKYYNPKDLEGKVYDPTTKKFKNSDGADLDKQPEAKDNIVSSLVNPNDAEGGKVGTPSTLTNVANGAKTFEPVAADGTKLVQVGDKFYPADKVENGILKPGTDAIADAKDPVKVANDGKWYLASQVEANGKPKENATPIADADLPNNIGKSGLVDFSNSNPNNAATVGDLQNLGFVVSTSDNGYSDQVRNANKVDFKGGNGIEVTGKTTADGTREITVSMKSGDVVSTNKEGKRGTITTPEGKVDVVKGDDNKWYKESDLGVDGKPKTGADAVDVTTNPVTINKGAGFVTGNQVGDAIEKSGWNVGLADSSKANDAFKGDSKALSADKLEKVNPDDNVRFADGKNTKVQAATMDEVNKDGKKITNTYVRFNVDLPISQITSEDKDGNKVAKAADGKWYPVKEGKPDTTKEALEPSNVRTSASMDPDGLGDKYTSTTSREEGLTPTQLGELTGKQEAAAEAAKTKIKELLKGQPDDVIAAASEAAVKAAKEEAKVQYLKDKGLDKGTGGTVISNVAWGTKPSDAVNVDQLQNSGINIHSSKVEGSTGKVISAHTSPTKVKMDETVNVDAGNNIEITRNGRDIAIATSMNPQFDSVQFGKEGPKITGKAAQPAKPATATSPATPAQPAELSVNGAKITGVAPGEISATSKDAINGSQLYNATKGIANVGNRINNLQRQVNKLGNRMNAGMATSAAMANLLQPHKPGQSVATAGIGQHKDQAAVAVGYSRVSDNGKYGIRFSMGANTQGEVTSGAAVGYFW